MEAPPYHEVTGTVPDGHIMLNLGKTTPPPPTTPPPSYEDVVSFIPPSNVTIGYDRSMSLQFCVHL